MKTPSVIIIGAGIGGITAATHLAKGSTHGLCHNLLQLGYFRPDFQHPRYHNLYFVGAST